jgi:hypothetical protein
VISVVRLANVVEVLGDVHRKLLVAIDVDHRSLAERLLEPDAHGPVHVLAIAPGLVVVVAAAHEHSHMNLVVSFVQDDTTYPAVIAAKGDSKFEFGDVPLPEPSARRTRRWHGGAHFSSHFSWASESNSTIGWPSQSIVHRSHRPSFRSVDGTPVWSSLIPLTSPILRHNGRA